MCHPHITMSVSNFNETWQIKLLKRITPTHTKKEKSKYRHKTSVKEQYSHKHNKTTDTPTHTLLLLEMLIPMLKSTVSQYKTKTALLVNPIKENKTTHPQIPPPFSKASQVRKFNTCLVCKILPAPKRHAARGVTSMRAHHKIRPIIPNTKCHTA